MKHGSQFALQKHYMLISVNFKPLFSRTVFNGESVARSPVLLMNHGFRSEQ